MKRLILAIVGFMSFVCADKAGAQTATFTTERDTVEATYFGGTLNIHNDITNISSSPIQITWKVLATDFPASWTTAEALGICDNVLCYNNISNSLLSGSTHTTNDIPPGSAATELDRNFYLTLTLGNAAAGTHYLTVQMKDASNYEKRVTFVVNKWAAGVSSTQAADNNVTLFPNPARNTVNLNFSPAAGIRTIAIYNLIGKMVTSYKVAGGAGKATLDLSSVPSGIYYVRLQNAQGEVVATRRFTRQ